MRKTDNNTARISEDGKTYLHRPAGSPFEASGRINQRSCFLCGTHRLMSEMTMRKFVGRAESVCADKADCSARRAKTRSG